MCWSSGWRSSNNWPRPPARAWRALEHAAGIVYAGFRFIRFVGRRHRQRHHQLLQRIFFASSQSDRQCAAAAGALVGHNAGRRHLQQRRQPELAAVRALDQEAAGVTSQVNSLTTAIAQLNQQIQSTAASGDARHARRSARAGHLAAFAADRHQPGDHREQRSLDHHHLRTASRFAGDELSAHHRRSEWRERFFPRAAPM